MAIVAVAGGGPAAATPLPSLTPPSAEEVDKFIADNGRWLDDAASAELRRLPPADQRRVLAGGAIMNCRDALGVIRARIRQAKDREALLAGGPPPASDSLAAALHGSMLASPATKEEVEAFVRTNVRWLSGEAEDIFRAMNPIDQKRVISAGTMSGCRDPIAVLQTRAKRAREMELEFDMLTKGKQGQVSVPDIPVPKFSAEFGMAYALAAPEVVTQCESRFAPPPVPAIGPAEEEEEPSAAAAGNIRGVGGVVEIMKPKYGCARGQRFKVVGETSSLIQMEGGKTAPRNHEGSGWRWVLKSEEDSKSKQAADKESAKAKEEARRLEIEKVLQARQEKLALEKEERERQKERRQLEKELAAKEEKEEKEKLALEKEERERQKERRRLEKELAAKEEKEKERAKEEKEKERAKEKTEADAEGDKKEKEGGKARYKKAPAEKDKKHSKETSCAAKVSKSASKDKRSPKGRADEEEKAKGRKRRRGSSSSSASPSESSSAKKRKRSRAEGKEGKKGKQSKRKNQVSESSSRSSRDSSSSPPAKGKKKKSARS